MSEWAPPTKLENLYDDWNTVISEFRDVMYDSQYLETRWHHVLDSTSWIPVQSGAQTKWPVKNVKQMTKTGAITLLYLQEIREKFFSSSWIHSWKFELVKSCRRVPVIQSFNFSATEGSDLQYHNSMNPSNFELWLSMPAYFQCCSYVPIVVSNAGTILILATLAEIKFAGKT